MIFEYNDEWKDEILNLASIVEKGQNTKQQSDRFDKLIEIASCTNDKQTLQVLMHVLEFELYGWEQRILNNFSSSDYKVYYMAFFERVPYILKKGDPLNADAAWMLMHGTSEHKFFKEEWEKIEKLIRYNLKQEDIEQVIQLLEAGDIVDIADEEDYPYFQFYKLFQKLLKETK